MDEAAILSAIAGLRCSRENKLPGDDIGLWHAAGRVYAATDSLIENTHYRDGWLNAAEIAYKLFARNWSDFLCKGIRPDAALLNLSLKKTHAVPAFVLPFLRTLDALFVRFKITLVGGDVARAASDHFTLTFLGSKGTLIPRRARRALSGMQVLQLGTVGQSDAARLKLTAGISRTHPATLGFRRPQVFAALPHPARLAASIDQSDSVAKSLRLLAEENGADLEIELSAMQISPAFRRLVAGNPGKIAGASEDLAVFALGSATVPRAALPKTAVAFRPIGQVKTIRSRRPVVHYLWHGRPLAMRIHDFEHF